MEWMDCEALTWSVFADRTPEGRRQWLLAAAALAAIATLPARAQGSWPSKPVTLVVAAPPGGPSDNFARQLAEDLAKLLGQAIVIDNRPGAAGQLAAEHVARSAPDGHTLLMSFAGNATAQTLVPRANLDFIRDFTHVTQMMAGANVLVTHPSTQLRTVSDLIRFAKSNPGKLSYASAGNGTSGHLAMELLKQRAGISLVHIPYRGGAQALNDTLAGQTQVMFLNTDAVMAHIRTGKLNGLAISSPKRSPLLPDLPTVAESGFQGYEATAWGGLSGPKGLSPAVVERLHSAVVQVLNGPFRARQEALGGTILGTSPTEFTAFFRSEIDRWAQVITAAGIKAD
jgi:tripartite-type tricarboxylate transporter receptor subunit TctC